MDAFEKKSVAPMLIGLSAGAFDSGDFIFELKLDGERCLAYLEQGNCELRNKRNDRLLPRFPELAGIAAQTRGRCILDGELIVAVGGRPNFAEVQRRSLLSNAFKIELAAEKHPASFVAYDILYLDGRELFAVPLMERKALLYETVRRETALLALSRHVDGAGVRLCEQAAAQGLEGVVAKRRDSLYRPGRRTKDWVKIKNMQDDDFVVCGRLRKAGGVASLALGQYRDGTLVYKGHVTMGVSGPDYARIQAQPAADCPFAAVPKGNGNAVWLRPELVCVVQFMERTAGGGMRQPVFKGLRQDKTPQECVEAKIF